MENCISFRDVVLAKYPNTGVNSNLFGTEGNEMYSSDYNMSDVGEESDGLSDDEYEPNIDGDEDVVIF